MADATTTYAIDNTAYYNVTAQTYCMRIVVQENFNSANAPTDDLLQKIPPTATNPVRIAKGTPAIYTLPAGSGLISPGTVVGTIRAATTSITVQQVESGQI